MFTQPAGILSLILASTIATNRTDAGIRQRVYEGLPPQCARCCADTRNLAPPLIPSTRRRASSLHSDMYCASSRLSVSAVGRS